MKHPIFGYTMCFVNSNRMDGPLLCRYEKGHIGKHSWE